MGGKKLLFFDILGIVCFYLPVEGVSPSPLVHKVYKTLRNGEAGEVDGEDEVAVEFGEVLAGEVDEEVVLV